MPEIRISQPPTPARSKSFGPGTAGRGASHEVSEVRKFLLSRGKLGDCRSRFSLADGALRTEHLRDCGLIVSELMLRSQMTWHKFGFDFFYQVAVHDPYSGQPMYWDPVNERFSALPFIYGTLVSSFLALLIAVPLAIGLAIFLTEMCPRILRGPLAFITELLAAIPSIIYGLWAVFVLVPLLREHVNPLLVKLLGWTGLFSTRIRRDWAMWRRG